MSTGRASPGKASKYPRTMQLLDFLARVGEQGFLRELARMGMVVGPVWIAGELLVPEDAVAYAGTLHGLGMQELAGEVMESLLVSGMAVVGEG